LDITLFATKSTGPALGWLCVSIGYSTTGKAGGYVRHATAAIGPPKFPATDPKNELL